MIFPRSYIAWDLETSGLDPITCKILEIGAARVEDGVILETRSWLLNWDIEIPEVITGITGITKELIQAEGRDPIECLREFLSFMGVAKGEEVHPHLTHNGIKFDIPFLVEAMLRNSIYSDIEIVTLKSLLNNQAIDTAVLVKGKKINALRKWNETFYEYAGRVMNVRAPGVKYNVGICCDEMGIDRSTVTQHRALGDVQLTHEIYKKFLEGSDTIPA